MEGRESDSGKGISLTDFRADHNKAIKRRLPTKRNDGKRKGHNKTQCCHKYMSTMLVEQDILPFNTTKLVENNCLLAIVEL